MEGTSYSFKHQAPASQLPPVSAEPNCLGTVGTYLGTDGGHLRIGLKPPVGLPSRFTRSSTRQTITRIPLAEPWAHVSTHQLTSHRGCGTPGPSHMYRSLGRPFICGRGVGRKALCARFIPSHSAAGRHGEGHVSLPSYFAYDEW